MRIVLSGMIAGVPGHGGATWSVLQYVRGFARLGHDVLVVEPVGAVTAAVRAYFRGVVARFELKERAALITERNGDSLGVPLDQVHAFARRADLLVNVNGMLRDPALLEGPVVRLYLDLDPVFNQLWDADGLDVGFEGHTHFATVGLGLGTTASTVPTGGRSWIPTPQPIVLADWPVATATTWDGLTTVGNWRSYGTIERAGVRYGQKAHSYRAFFELPRRVPVPVYAGLAIHPDERHDLEALEANGWRLVEPAAVAGTPDRYQAFVQGSWAELGIAKEGYVVSESGWFSDRSVCYLASGRPVLAQDTGFARHLPVGDGLIAFRTLDEAVAGTEELRRTYERHRRQARNLAEDMFDSDKVLFRLLERVGVA